MKIRKSIDNIKLVCYDVLTMIHSSTTKNKNRKGSKMKTQKIKNNIITILKVTSVATFVSSAIYFGIPKLTLNDVLSLSSLVVSFALAFTFIKR